VRCVRDMKEHPRSFSVTFPADAESVKTLYDAGNAADAADRLSAWLAERVDCADGWFWKALWQSEAGAVADAVTSLEKALLAHPDFPSAAGSVLYQCAEALRISSILLWPFIPDACRKSWQSIGCAHHAERLSNNGSGDLRSWEKWGQLVPGPQMGKGVTLFPRYQPQAAEGEQDE
jgi:hypothetical protein